jgi:hypothetical protein
MGAAKLEAAGGAASSPRRSRRRLEVLGDKARAWGRRSTSRWRALPDFLVVGAQKSGSTSLMQCLRQHPDVLSVPGSAEVHYFDRNWDRGERWYRSHFRLERSLASARAARGGTVLCGEKTPEYLFHPLAPERAAQTVPDARIIAILREPVARAASQYAMSRRSGVERLELADAIEAEQERLEPALERLRAGAPPAEWLPAMHYSYVARGRYLDQLEAWCRYFPRERVHVLRMEDFTGTPDKAFSAVTDFLGLSPFTPKLRAWNAASKPYSIDPVAQERLAAAFEEPNRRLAAEFGISWP